MNIDRFIKDVRHIIGRGPHDLHAPLLHGNERKYTNLVLGSGHLAAGKWVERFEHDIARFIGAKHAIAVMNGTCGLHAVISVLPKLEEYRIPSLTFVATANAVSYGQNKIRFVEPNAYSDIAVDFLGHPHFNIGAHIKDAAQSLGSKWHGEYTGSRGTAVFSFNQNKILTTGGGGMVTTDDDEVADRIRHLVTTARVQHKWETSHNAVAFNYRMSDLSAAIGVAQLEQLPKILHYKRALAEKYIEIMQNNPDVIPYTEPENAQSNYWLNAVNLKDPSHLQPVMQALHDKGIKARPLWTPIHQLPMYQDCAKNDMALTEKMAASMICLPSSPALGIKYA